MTANSFWGINPSGITTATRPLASGIERTMYWLDRVAEQHGWTSHYSTDPLINVSGFNWKRHNGIELERFVPKDQSPFRLAGYPLHTKDFWLNFRNIIQWAGDKIIEKWDLYGGQESGVYGERDGLLGTQNTSGVFWNDPDKWINYGNYVKSPYNAGFLLNNSGEPSFVDYRESSKIDYMGRHGKVSNADYTQYIPFPFTQRSITAYPYHRNKHVYVLKYLTKKNFNTVDSDFLISRNPYMSSSDFNEVQNAVSGLWASGNAFQIIHNTGWSSDTYIDTIYNGPYYNDSQNKVFCGYNIIRKQAVDGLAILSPIAPSAIFILADGDGFGPPGNICTPFGSGNVLTFLAPHPLYIAGYGGRSNDATQSFDYLEYGIDAQGYINSAAVYTVKGRYTGGDTHEIESIEANLHKSYDGMYFPLSTRYYSSTSGDRYYGNNYNYFRSFTGFTPEDTLDLVSILQNYGIKDNVSGIISYSKYDNTRTQVNNVKGVPPFINFAGFCEVDWPGCVGNSSSIVNSSLTNNIGPNMLFDISDNYNLKLVYGFVEFPFNSGDNSAKILSVQDLITQSIDNGLYTNIANISISGGYTSIDFNLDDYFLTTNNDTSPGVVGENKIGVINPLPGGPTTGPQSYAFAGTPYGALFEDRIIGPPPITITQTLNYDYFTDYKKIGSMSGIVDIVPTANIMYISIIPDGDVLSDFMATSLPSLKFMDEQSNYTQNASYSFDMPGVSFDSAACWEPYFRFWGSTAGSYSYNVYDAPICLSGAIDSSIRKRLRAMAFNERSLKIQSNTDNSGTMAIGQGLHTSYGAVNNGDDKIINDIDNMSLYSDTKLWR